MSGLMYESLGSKPMPFSIPRCYPGLVPDVGQEGIGDDLSAFQRYSKLAPCGRIIPLTGGTSRMAGQGRNNTTGARLSAESCCGKLGSFHEPYANP